MVPITLIASTAASSQSASAESIGKISMLFGDAKASLGKLVTEMKNV